AQAPGQERLLRPWQSSAWGYVRTLSSEHPELGARLIDVGDYEEAAEELIAEALVLSDEDEVCLYGARRYVARLERQGGVRSPRGAGWGVRTRHGGRLDELELVGEERQAELSADEVEVRVAALGLNFRDVLNALGMYPGGAGELGGDFAGRVERVG